MHTESVVSGIVNARNYTFDAAFESENHFSRKIVSRMYDFVLFPDQL